MSDLYALVSILLLFSAAFLLTRYVRPANRLAAIFIYAMTLSTIIVWIGYLLSDLNHLGELSWWMYASITAAALVALPLAISPALRAVAFRSLSLPREIEVYLKRANYRTFSTWVLLLLVNTTILVAIANYIIILALEPAAIDALTYHLSRIAYYLQHNNMRPFDATYWAQIVPPKIAHILMLYTFLVSGRVANITALVQFFAFYLAMGSIYGITRQLGASRRRSACCALLFGLIPIAIAEGATPQNDMVLTAFLGVTVYFLLAYRSTQRVSNLVWATLGFCLAAGVKSSIVAALPSLLIVVLFVLLSKSVRTSALPRHFGIALASLIAGLLLITIPSGYQDNYRLFHNVIGPKYVRLEQSYAGRSPGELLKFGTLNSVRYAVNFTSLDGFPDLPVVKSVQGVLNKGMFTLLKWVKIDIRGNEGTRFPYQYDHMLSANENTSFWGIIGMLLIWPGILLCLFGCTRSPGARLFALAMVIFFLAQAFISPYDPFRGRYLLNGLLFALPPLAFLTLPTTHFALRGYLTIVLVLGCLAASSAAYFRYMTYIFPFTYQGRPVPSTLTLSESAQLARNYPMLTYSFSDYKQQVPEHATIAIDVQPCTLDFVFFGARVTRTLIPIRSYNGKCIPIPQRTDYLIYDVNSPYYNKTDATKDTMLLPEIKNYFYLTFLRKLR